jgi:hypothetical protein
VALEEGEGPTDNRAGNNDQTITFCDCCADS